MSEPQYEYLTEAVDLAEMVVGKTTSGSAVISDIGKHFTHIASYGWELVQVAQVPVVGEVFKSKEFRWVAVAIFRRPLQ